MLKSPKMSHVTLQDLQSTQKSTSHKTLINRVNIALKIIIIFKNIFHFSETFLETHKNVSILYADICNFTPLTEKFTSKKFVNGREVTEDRIEELVATLNDLFTKFDEAAEVSF